MSVTSLEEWRKKRGERSASRSPSTQNLASDHAGETPTNEELETLGTLMTVLAKARLEPYTTKSDFARRHATEIAIAASEGLISTRVNDGQFTNIWLITQEGLQFMEAIDDVFGG